MISGHGNELHLYNNTIVADFSSNVIPSGVHPRLVEHLKGAVTSIANYPQPDAQLLAQLIAQHHGVSAGCVSVFNGSTEGFYLLAQLHKNQQSQIFVPSFAEYADACRCHSHRVNFTHNAKISPCFKTAAQMVWIGNPNNPDGLVTPLYTIEAMCCNNRNTLFVVDEAYSELCSNHQSAVPLVGKLSNLVVVKSFTKLFAIPGVRLGYTVTSLPIASKLSRIRMPWSVNALAIAAGKFIVENYQQIKPNVNTYLDAAQELQRDLSAVAAVNITPSLCTYCLCKTQVGKASNLKQYLATAHGLLVRDASNFHSLSSMHFRVATQGNALDKKLIQSINTWSQLQYQ